MPATYEKIATTTLGSAGSITFNSIPATYTDLRIVFVGQTNSGAVAFRFNSDTGNNYSHTYVYADGSAAYSGRTTSTGAGNASVVSANNGQPVLCELDIFSYAGSTYKTALAKTSEDLNGSGYVVISSQLWSSTSAITSVQLLSLSGNLITGTTATLYGIKKA